MAKGSEQPTWHWAGDVRECDTCHATLLIKNVGLFYTDAQGARGIRCMECVEDRRDQFIARTRREMGLSAR